MNNVSLKYSLESLSQLSTFDFQSQVCLSMSKARPAGQRTAARRMVPARPALSHLKINKFIEIFRGHSFCAYAILGLYQTWTPPHEKRYRGPITMVSLAMITESNTPYPKLSEIVRFNSPFRKVPPKGTCQLPKAVHGA